MGLVKTAYGVSEGLRKMTFVGEFPVNMALLFGIEKEFCWVEGKNFVAMIDLTEGTPKMFVYKKYKELVDALRYETFKINVSLTWNEFMAQGMKLAEEKRSEAV